MSMVGNKYYYEGPVKGFQGVLRVQTWSGFTIAVSERRALSNLSFQYKREKGLSRNAYISLDRKYLIKMPKTDKDGYIYYDEEMRRMINESI